MALCLLTPTGHAFTALYVFGDSLSDTGRSPAPAGSYFEGRFSNGPLWVEYLSAQLGIPYNPTNNFAVSGSTTTDLPGQLAGMPASAGLQTALFTLKSGGNDFIATAETGLIDSTSWGLLITNMVDQFTNAIGVLYTNGARHIIVGNLPNLAQTPAFMALDTAAYSNLVASKVVLFNQVLASALAREMQQYSGLRLYLSDDHAAFSNILSAPAARGFTVTMRGALEDPDLADKSFTGPGANYVFWDSLHPTTKLDALTAAGAFHSVAVQLQLARSGTNFNLDINNLYPAQSYSIESSTNLAAWSAFQTLTPSTTNATVTLTNRPGKGGVYYRVSY